jgi:hypothetical protein
MTEKYVGAAIKNESTDPKGTTEDERYVTCWWALYYTTLRGGIFMQ